MEDVQSASRSNRRHAKAHQQRAAARDCCTSCCIRGKTLQHASAQRVAGLGARIRRMMRDGGGCHVPPPRTRLGPLLRWRRMLGVKVVEIHMQSIASCGVRRAAARRLRDEHRRVLHQPSSCEQKTMSVTSYINHLLFRPPKPIPTYLEICSERENVAYVDEAQSMRRRRPCAPPVCVGGATVATAQGAGAGARSAVVPTAASISAISATRRVAGLRACSDFVRPRRCS